MRVLAKVGPWLTVLDELDGAAGVRACSAAAAAPRAPGVAGHRSRSDEREVGQFFRGEMRETAAGSRPGPGRSRPSPPRRRRSAAGPGGRVFDGASGGLRSGLVGRLDDGDPSTVVGEQHGRRVSRRPSPCRCAHTAMERGARLRPATGDRRCSTQRAESPSPRPGAGRVPGRGEAPRARSRRVGSGSGSMPSRGGSAAHRHATRRALEAPGDLHGRSSQKPR